MIKIKSFLNSALSEKNYHPVLALLAASAVLRKEKVLRETLLFLKENKFNKRKIYEVLLQTYLFAGYPSALISLSVYSEYFKADERWFEDWDINKFKKRGGKNCRNIYGSKFEKLISNISSFSPELSDWLVTEGYGKVIGRKGLSLKEREVCNIAVLSALKFESQLYSHLNGGHRTGLHWKEIESVIDSLALLDNNCMKFGKKVLNTFIRTKGL